MRAVVQRVRDASVSVEGDVVAAVGEGLLVLLGIAVGDNEAGARWMAEKIIELRIFADEQGRFDRSLRDTGGEILVVSQFTLYADVRKGRRPSFTAALSGERARGLYEAFVENVRQLGFAPRTGQFGADMQVASVNDGPVTVIVEHP
jgi:D-tyrosyl-tRNA(Tyr) deacylase